MTNTRNQSQRVAVATKKADAPAEVRKLQQKLIELDAFERGHLDNWLEHHAPISTEDTDQARNRILCWIGDQTAEDIEYFIGRGWSAVFEEACPRGWLADTPATLECICYHPNRGVCDCPKHEGVVKSQEAAQ